MRRQSAGTMSPAESRTTSPGYQMLYSYLTRLSVANHQRAKSDGTPQGVDGMFGMILLNKVEHHAEKDDRHDDDETGDLAAPGRQAARKKENENERIGQAVDDLSPEWAPSMCQCVVGPIPDKTASCLFSRKALQPCCI